eukprot:m.6352 g.6352  ORF g.6352 m.6352 type:complete len:251 (-) comp2610_c0_seq1:400-1152(-)
MSSNAMALDSSSPTCASSTARVAPTSLVTEGTCSADAGATTTVTAPTAPSTGGMRTLATELADTMSSPTSAAARATGTRASSTSTLSPASTGTVQTTATTTTPAATPTPPLGEDQPAIKFTAEPQHDLHDDPVVNDPAFLQGLAKIGLSLANPAHEQDIARARAFFLQRAKSVPGADKATSLESTPRVFDLVESGAEATKGSAVKLSFSEVMALVAAGQPVPGCKQVTVQLAPPEAASASTTPRPRKPWE